MKRRARSQVRFAVCTENKGYKVALELDKLYRVIPDETAEKRGYLRIFDESGEDYGYSADRFFAIDVPKPLEKPCSPLRHDDKSFNFTLQRTRCARR